MAALTLASHNLCPYVQRAAIALAEKRVTFARVYVDLSDKPDWFHAISPLGKAPLLSVVNGGGEQVIFSIGSGPVGASSPRRAGRRNSRKRKSHGEPPRLEIAGKMSPKRAKSDGEVRSPSLV